MNKNIFLRFQFSFTIYFKIYRWLKPLKSLIHGKYVVVPTVKASNNTTDVLKTFHRLFDECVKCVRHLEHTWQWSKHIYNALKWISLITIYQCYLFMKFLSKVFHHCIGYQRCKSVILRRVLSLVRLNVSQSHSKSFWLKFLQLLRRTLEILRHYRS